MAATEHPTEAATPVGIELAGGRPLSPMQRALWTSQLVSPDKPVQNNGMLSHIDGAVDAHRLALAFDRVVAASDSLRTRIVRNPTASGTADQVVLVPAGRFAGDEPVASELVEADADDFAATMARRCRRPVDMAVQAFDSVIATHPDGTVSWYLNLHHTVTDATSSAIVFAATAAVYHGDEPPTGSYYQWVAELAQAAASGADTRIERARRHWDDRAPAPRLGHLYRHPEAGFGVGSAGADATRVPLDIDDGLVKATVDQLDGDLRLMSHDLGWTVVLITALAVHVHRITGTDRFAIGMPVHNRSTPTAATLIGPIVEVFPVDIDLTPDPDPDSNTGGDGGDEAGTAALTFRQVHRRVARAVMKTLQMAQPGTSPAGDYEAIVNVIPRAEQARFGEFDVSTTWLDPGAIDASHVLRLQMTRYVPAHGEARFDFFVDVNHRGADPEHRRRLPHHFRAALEALVTDPDQTIDAPDLLTPAEADLVAAWGDGGGFIDHAAESGPVVERLLDGLAERSDTAIADGERNVSGADLARWVLATAEWLTSRGVSEGDRVAIDLPRSIEAVVAIHATLAAGASFVPLDPAQPLSRRQRLADRAGCVLMLSTPGNITDLADATSSPGFAPVGRGPDDEAYLLYTSGSTGEPKGVPITQRGLAHYIAFAAATYTGLDHQSGPPVAGLFSALTFDLTVTTVFMPLLVGGRLEVIEADGPAGLAEIARRTDITWLKATPSHLQILNRLLGADHRLDTLVVGGEAFGTRLASQLLDARPHLAIFNEYGPTEAVVGCMDYRVEPDLLSTQADVPIGRPAPGVQLRIVDPYLRPVPLGAAGELLISHRGMTAGYLAGDHLADGDGAPPRRDPFVTVDGERFYRSGDLVRLQDDERLVYLGRIDEQVKVGGIRLEPIEVEQALEDHPLIESAAVRLWSPSTLDASTVNADGVGAGPATTAARPRQHCVTCGLPDNVPGVVYDDDGVCSSCHAYERVAPITQSWFRTPDDLADELAAARAQRSGDHDVLHLLSGGKDSTYALYRLVELGAHPYVMTLDNGFISEGAKDNVRRSVADLGLDHEFVTLDGDGGPNSAMNAIFADSLATYSNVCNGCYKAIYTVATTRADELGIPMIVTGLSRGQLFETRLIPQQFSAERFDPDAIDRAVIEARKIYHRTDDAVNQLLDTSVFAGDEVFDRIRYLDFYRYVDVELSDMLQFLETRAPWVRPADTGRSTNCLINAAGIFTHLTEQGYHNYAMPYAWDVRLGHKTRDEAIAELDDQLDEPAQRAEILSMLAEVGYEPRRREVLTAWIRAGAGVDRDQLDPASLRAFLNDRLPAYAVPSAFVLVDELPLTANGKLNTAALPAPTRVHRPGAGLHVAATTEIEKAVVAVWEQVLGVEPIGVEDDFFALGGDSLAALEMIVTVGERLGIEASEDLAFRHTTPRLLADALEQANGRRSADPSDPSGADDTAGSVHPPAADADNRELSSGQQAILFDQRLRPDDIMYNLGRVYRVRSEALAAFDVADLRAALEQVAERHGPLSTTLDGSRRRLSGAEAVDLTVNEPVAVDELDQALAPVHRRPFDLTTGPLLRVLVQPVDDGTTAILFAVHHASADADSYDVIWQEVGALLEGRRLPDLPTDYATYCAWQLEQRGETDRAFWLDQARPAERTPARLATVAAGNTGADDTASGDMAPDGFLLREASVGPDELAAGSGASPFATALVAIAAALDRFCDGDDLEVGLITSTRTDREADELVGYFLNTVPFRLTGDDRDPRALGPRLGEALSHRSYPLARILSDRRQAGLGDEAPSIYLAYDDFTNAAGSTATGPLAGASERVLSNGAAVADLTLFVERRADRVDLSAEFKGSVMTEAEANALLDVIDAELKAVTASGRLEPGPGAQRSGRVVTGSELIGEPVENETPTLQRIWAAGAERGDAPAVVCGDATLSWSDLLDRAEAVADRLAAAHIQPGDPVAVHQPRSVELVVSMLGVLRAGAVYVPIDPSYPADRIRLLADRARLKAVIVGDDQTTVAPGAGDAKAAKADRRVFDAVPIRLTVAADGVDGAPWSELAATARALPDPDGVAYVIFTSGSTGEPKPVSITHRQLALSTNARDQFYPPVDAVDGDSALRFLMVSSPSFDSSIVGLFWPLVSGGTVVLPDDHEVHDFEALVELCERASITHLLAVPTLYQAMLAAVERSGDVGPLGVNRRWPEQIMVAGEACSAALVDQHFRLFPTSRLANEYGPTEATVWATAHHVKLGDNPVPIGTPVPGVWTAVIDEADRIRPLGVAGELVIGGPNVSLDHRSRLDRSANSGDLPEVYRTGDRVVMIDSGSGPEIHFLGRADNQLNVNGARVEPEEVEQALTTVAGVTAAVVLAQDPRSMDEMLASLAATDVAPALAAAATDADPASALRRRLERLGGRSQLVAHVEVPAATATTGGAPSVEDLRQAVATLPATARPSRFVVHPELPRTPNGKVDRAAAGRLPVTSNLTPSPAAVPAASDTRTESRPDHQRGAKRLAGIFAATLGLDTVGVDDDFFDLGGHSLLAVELLVSVEETLGHRLPASALYQHPTPAALARLLPADQAEAAGSDLGATTPTATATRRKTESILVPIQPNGDRVPLFAIHVLGVDAVYFRPLSARLGPEQPVFGLGQARVDKDLSTEIPTSVEELAVTYSDEVEAVRPDGPLVVAAISLGGVVAYATAQELLRRGRDIELLTLFDSVGPDAEAHTLSVKGRLGAHAEAFTQNPSEYVSGRLEYNGLRFKRWAEIAEEKARSRLGMEANHRLQVRRFIEDNVASQGSYRYEPFTRPMLVFKAANDPFNAHLTEIDLGWRSVALGGLNLEVVPGDHQGMVAEPNVAVLARHLKAALDRINDSDI